MKITGQNHKRTTAGRRFADVCLAPCLKLIAQIEKAKDAILAEFRATHGTHEQLLRLAVNEAEALAWQTAYPYLVFPALATEKIQAITAWGTRQRAIRRTHSLLPLAA